MNRIRFALVTVYFCCCLLSFNFWKAQGVQGGLLLGEGGRGQDIRLQLAMEARDRVRNNFLLARDLSNGFTDNGRKYAEALNILNLAIAELEGASAASEADVAEIWEGDWSYIYAKRAEVLSTLGDSAKAKADCEVAIRLQTTDSAPYHILGRMYIKKEDYAKASEIYMLGIRARLMKLEDIKRNLSLFAYFVSPFIKTKFFSLVGAEPDKFSIQKLEWQIKTVIKANYATMSADELENAITVLVVHEANKELLPPPDLASFKRSSLEENPSTDVDREDAN